MPNEGSQAFTQGKLPARGSRQHAGFDKLIHPAHREIQHPSKVSGGCHRSAVQRLFKNLWPWTEKGLQGTRASAPVGGPEVAHHPQVTAGAHPTPRGAAGAATIR